MCRLFVANSGHRFHVILGLIMVFLVMLLSRVLEAAEEQKPLFFDSNAEVITIENFIGGETIYYPLPLLKGSASQSNWVSITNGDETTQWPVNSQRWRAFVPLHGGLNQLVVTAEQGTQIELDLFYSPSTNPKSIQLFTLLRQIVLAPLMHQLESLMVPILHKIVSA